MQTLRAALAAVILVLSTPLIAKDEPNNFVQWREGLASSAQPNGAWLRSVRERKYDLVINLAPPQSFGSIMDEGGIVGSRGVAYVNIPVDFMSPSEENFRLFSEIMKANAGRNVFVHCQVNLRGSSFVFLYRVIHEDANVSDALGKLTGVWSPDPVWRKFIEQTLAAHGKKAEIL